MTLLAIVPVPLIKLKLGLLLPTGPGACISYTSVCVDVCAYYVYSSYADSLRATPSRCCTCEPSHQQVLYLQTKHTSRCGCMRMHAYQRSHRATRKLTLKHKQGTNTNAYAYSSCTAAAWAYNQPCQLYQPYQPYQKHILTLCYYILHTKAEATILFDKAKTKSIELG